MSDVPDVLEMPQGCGERGLRPRLHLRRLLDRPELPHAAQHGAGGAAGATAAAGGGDGRDAVRAGALALAEFWGHVTGVREQEILHAEAAKALRLRGWPPGDDEVADHLTDVLARCAPCWRPGPTRPTTYAVAALRKSWWHETRQAGWRKCGRTVAGVGTFDVDFDRVPSGEAATAWAAADWDRLLRILNAPDRRAVLRIYRDGLSAVEYAREAGLSIQRVRQILARSLARLGRTRAAAELAGLAA